MHKHLSQHLTDGGTDPALKVKLHHIPLSPNSNHHKESPSVFLFSLLLAKTKSPLLPALFTTTFKVNYTNL